MFTGLVQEIGRVLAIKRLPECHRVSLHAPKTATTLQRGESVAINGVCLSVVGMRHGTLTFEVIPQTRHVTNVGKLSPGDCVNVERSLTLSDRLNGHLVLGHVDGMGRVIRCRRTAGETVLEIRIDRALRRYLVPKGPVAVDGVSLTVGAQVSGTQFTVYLIPETIRKTTLGLRRVGDLVNIEVDYFAKLIAQLLDRRQR